jgi:exosome complex component RRP42
MPSFSFSPAELAFLHTSLSLNPPVRPDSRTSTQFRALSAETDILPATNGSAHLSFSDGSEAIVGVKAEVEKTTWSKFGVLDEVDYPTEKDQNHTPSRGSPSWVALTIDLPSLRDDDPSLIFLSEMLRESLISSSSPSLPDALVINKKWHWKLYIDVLLISPHGLSSYPLPLLSLTTHLALLATRLPKLKSHGEEDPLFDDDWEASEYLYRRVGNGKGKGKDATQGLSRPPVTLLVMVVGSNVIFDPSREELAVADGVFAVSVAESTTSTSKSTVAVGPKLRICSVRTIDTPARDTMKGVPISGGAGDGQPVPGVWQPRIGGIKRTALTDIVKAVLGENGKGGVAADVLEGVEGFVRIEAGSS